MKQSELYYRETGAWVFLVKMESQAQEGSL